MAQLIIIPPKKTLVGAGDGRGPCTECGAVAELVLERDELGRVLEACLPCAVRPPVPMVVARAA